MSTQNTIQLTLTVKDDGSVVVQQFGKNSEDALNKTSKGAAAGGSALATLKSNWLAVTAAAAATYVVVKKVTDAVSDVALAAARYETLGVVMRVVGNNAGYTGAQMETFAQGLEKTGISMTASRESLSRMIQAQLDLNQSSKLARVAQDAAVIGNINSSEAFGRMVYGIQSAQTEMLRTIGINVSFENSYAQVAKETGRAASSFSEVEKAGIRLNTVLDAGKNIAGTYEAAMGTAGKQLLSLERHVENLKVLLGSAFTPALAEIIETITGAITDVNGELGGESKEKIEDWGNNFRLTLISVEAEIMRLAMFIDKIGGTLSSAVMLATGVGAGLGKLGLPDFGDTKRFEDAADWNIKLESRYKTTEKALEDLAVKYNKIEAAMTPAGKAAAKAAAEAAEVKVLALRKATKATEEAAGAERKMQESAVETAKKITQTAKTDIDNLKSRLSEYQTYYDSLKAKMDKNTADEKKHLDAIKALRQQSIDLDNSAAAQLALINGTNKNQTPQQTYDTGRSALNQKFMDTTNNLSGQNGQEQIKALQDYMQQVTALQQQFAQGIQGPANIFGKPQDIMSAAKVAEDASSDINRALALQQSAVAQLTEEKSKQAQADQQWGQVLQDEAVKAKTAIADIGATITDLSAKMEAMQKTIDIRGIDNATPIINDIAARLEQLHDKTITITAKYAGNASGALAGSTGGSGNTPLYGTGWDEPAPATSEPAVLDKFASGTPYVPRTGIYHLDRGEAVVPAAQNNSGKAGATFSGDIVIQIPANAAPQRPEDWRSITRDYIVPELRKMNA